MTNSNTTRFKKFLYTIVVLTILSAAICVLSYIALEAILPSSNETLDHIIAGVATVSMGATYILIPLELVLSVGIFVFQLRKFKEYALFYLGVAVSCASVAGMWFYVFNMLGRTLEGF